jgi:hypothetical protein
MLSYIYIINKILKRRRQPEPAEMFVETFDDEAWGADPE